MIERKQRKQNTTVGIKHVGKLEGNLQKENSWRLLVVIIFNFFNALLLCGIIV